MSHKEHEVAGIMAKDVEDERRLRKYAMKYETIVKQFDELKGIATDSTTMKWRKRSRGGASGANAVLPHACRVKVMKHCCRL
ncbi:hypothetical protein SESBI_50320 [Sesbania bispinosa]|nr:hypothetical protein SESBI_50320 [Sesbania bispinosa]